MVSIYVTWRYTVDNFRRDHHARVSMCNEINRFQMLLQV